MELKDYLTIIIPSFVTLLGFVVSFRINKREHLQSMQEFKLEKQLSDLYGLQKDVFNYIDMICLLIAHPNKTPTGFDELQDKIYSTVICAGSEDSVKLIVYIRNLICAGLDDNIEVSNRELIAAYVLLAMQIKYDTTGIKTSPNTWYIGKFTTQKILETSDFYNESVNHVNSIVEKLKLEEFLRIIL